MSDPHATTDQLADLLEGSLADEQAEAVRTHLAGCASCASVRDQLDALPALLAATSVPPMPAAVASRLDAVVAAESSRRQAQQESPDTAVVVVQQRRLRRDRARRWFAGAVVAATVLVAISVVPDLVGVGGSSSDSADSSTAGAGVAEDSSGDSLLQSAPGRLRVPGLDSTDFGASVERLHDSGPPAFRALPSRLADQAEPGDELNGPAESQDSGRLGSGAACASDALAGAGVTGTPGPLVRVDGELARLVTAGPARRSTVEAYSCRTGDLLAAAGVDLSR